MPDTTPATPAVWIEGDALHEAIAAAIWDQCLTQGGILVDDPRNIAAVAATTARLVLGTTDQQPETAPTDRRDHIAQAARDLGHLRWDAAAIADAVLAVLPAPTDRAAEVAEFRAQIANFRTMYAAADARTSDLIDERDVLRAEVERLRTDRATFEALAAEWEKRGRYGDSSITDRARELQAVLATEAHPALRRLTPNEHDRAWHAIEGSAGEDGADPGTVLNAVLHALRIDPPTPEEEQAASPSRRLADEAQQPETEAHR